MIREPREVEIEKAKYQIGRLKTMDQFHVFKRLLPLFAGISAEKGEDLKAKAGSAFAAIATSIQGLSDKDCDEIIMTCMTVVRRKEGNAWAPVMARDGKQFMYEDISLATMLNLTGEVIQENLSDFFNTAGATSDAAKTAPAQN